jgi:hypothetical protein
MSRESYVVRRRDGETAGRHDSQPERRQDASADVRVVAHDLWLTTYASFRWLVVACLIVTIWFTWPLWQVRDAPPLLPALPGVPSVDIGLPLIGALLAVLFAPLLGMAAATLLVVYAVLVDQTRLQPEIVSLLFLLWGTLPSPVARGFARAHLISLWFFSGFNKLLSPAFFDDLAPFLLSAFVPDPAPWQGLAFGYLLAFGEMGLGLLGLAPRTRRLAAIGAFVLHMSILLSLSPLGHDHNSAVWPWNVALAFAGFAYLWPWRESVLASLLQVPLWARASMLVLVAMPLGFYVGKVDAYLAHNLYSSTIARAEVKCRVACFQMQDPANTWTSLNVPLPPEHRLFEQYFALTCRPGDEMRIVDPRAWYRRQGLDERVVTCLAS